MDEEKAKEFLEDNQEGIEKLAQNPRFLELSEKFAKFFQENGITNPNDPSAIQKIATYAMKDPKLLGEFMEFAQLMQEEVNLEEFQNSMK